MAQQYRFEGDTAEKLCRWNREVGRLCMVLSDLPGCRSMWASRRRKSVGLSAGHC